MTNKKNSSGVPLVRTDLQVTHAAELAKQVQEELEQQQPSFEEAEAAIKENTRNAEHKSQ